MAKIVQKQNQKQIQIQHQKMSQTQIRALKFLEMGNQDLREVILKECAENPAIEIVYDPIEYSLKPSSAKKKSYEDSEKYQSALENTEDRTETLQAHLMHQLNSMNLTPFEIELSTKLIYNLDKNGFYGSNIEPLSFIKDNFSIQKREILENCIKRIQKMDPVGTCCKNWEESLFIQAQISEEATPLTLFLLDGHMEMLEPPEASKVYEKLIQYKKDWHKKKFATEIILDKIHFSKDDVQDSIQFILQLNPLPAQGYSTTTNIDSEKPDVILEISKVPGSVLYDDFNHGVITGDSNYHFQIKYASGVLPELKISDSFAFDKENYSKAQELMSNLAFRESSIVLQGCAIVCAQKKFFLEGPEHLKPLTRREVAQMLGIHESTVSRMASRKASKYIQTEMGLFPASYFFSAGVKSESSDGNDFRKDISSKVVKMEIQKIMKEYSGNSLSDSKLTQLLNEKGIKIARRTVTKYRIELGINNSYRRK